MRTTVSNAGTRQQSTSSSDASQELRSDRAMSSLVVDPAR